MDFSIRLARAAAIMTWISLGIGIVAATLMDRVGVMPGVTLHLTAVYVWSVFGAAVAALLTFLPALATRSHFVLKNITAFRAFLLISDTVWVTANCTLTGGIRGPFWVCYLGVVLFAAVSMKALQASLFGFAATAGLVLSTYLAHTMDRGAVAVLVLVGATYPLVSWFNSTLAAAVWQLRAQASAERKSLEARVKELSAALERAAEGDLAVRATIGDDGTLAQLGTAFNATVSSLRVLVGQVRGGGEQIAASAGELLASAEEHAASATQQSSAVSETTSTIEELAATAGQIAETSEAVARYAAETL
ncbi:MAG: methyl-accepting chemotaxis protein, partial [Actinomycetota bacterium]|nr:methyl-accepting chemotaxis protein [Actinomycetota bacterium]